MSVTISHGIAHVVVSNPNRGHSLDIDGLDAAAETLKHDTSIRAIVLTGAQEGSFCNGGDVKAFAASSDPGQYLRSIALPFHRFISTLLDADVPTIAAVRGWAAGGGMSLACATDLAIGGPGTQLLPAYPTIGYSTDGGLSWTLPRIVGRRAAASIILTNAPLDAPAAHRLGILSEVVDDDEAVVQRAFELAEQFARGPRGAYAEIKQLLRTSGSLSATEQLQLEVDAIARTAGSDDGREGVAALLDRRAPRFQ
ncbi:enoyl-CoA hydratase/isomerase family protein [Hoyosella rhizosphaerae]|uniref:Enoyl-CoA hydratase/isomerase n=1 Tax=Hoyosella rhizosphaerae TaxID=1755582 RepID=A0A916TZF3_9ACTN|nr:enoyl-CoA hydratase-related protein [Hoyosella rhizosphaerae]MBN4927255.1 enoyl-CoA hydratase/isomerase family protein [Hoyosella rhizosphaerae]GGC52729.1 putative enoyl-CoA hydratase/isomerase [Hoyosella rhizosphaerae]